MGRLASLVWLLAVWSVSAGLAAPLEQPLVDVDFRLTERTYAVQFNAAQRNEIEGSVTASLVAELQESVRFLKFSEDGQEERRLIFELDRRDVSGSDELFEIGFHIRVEGLPQCDGSSAYQIFRPDDAFGTRLGTPEELIREIELKLLPEGSSGASSQGFVDLVSRPLGCVPIGDEGEFRTESLTGWLIPFQRVDLCLDGMSQMTIRGDLVLQGLSMPDRSFVAELLDNEDGQIFCLPSEGQPAIQHLSNASDVRIKGIYVTRYIRLDPCQALVDPDDSGLGGGSQ